MVPDFSKLEVRSVADDEDENKLLATTSSPARLSHRECEITAPKKPLFLACVCDYKNKTPSPYHHR
jgi:hypothetical protein